jgi:hypothetical protein
MSRQFRYRITALALGALIFGAPLLTNGTASAEQQSEGGRQVTFDGGGVLDFSCRSRPDVESLVVPADSRVRVINRTGYSARLRLAGEAKGTLPDDASTEVVFRRGTTEVTLEPNCPLGENPAPLLVTASPSATTMMLPDPTPLAADDDSSASAAASGSSGTPSGPVAGTTLPGSAATTRSTRTSAAGHAGMRDPARTSAARRAAAQRTTPGAARKTKTKTATSTADSPVPAFAGMPPGDKKTLVPDVPQPDLAPVTQDAEPAAVSPPTTSIAAAEPVAAMAPISESGPIGMLGLIAAVCVMGVGAAAIRAIVSQRANRANVA